MEAEKHQVKTYFMDFPLLLGRTKPWDPLCISNPFWQMEQGEPAQPELSTKVGLNFHPNELPYCFLVSLDSPKGMNLWI